jgi:hypothetical protein
MRSCIWPCVALLALMAGCQAPEGQKPYPDPLFGTRPPAPRKNYMPAPAAPAPRYVAPRPAEPEPEPVTLTAKRDANWMPPRGMSKKWTDIVIHHSATPSGGARAFDEAHKRKHWDELGYHFVIGNGSDTRDGQIEVGSRWTKQKHGAHCKTADNYYNEHGIGICLVGNLDTAKPSAAQMASLNRLLAFLSEACKIKSDHIQTHGGLTGRTKCPGRNLSLWQVRKTLAKTKTYSASNR